jgi:hypothetical protein
VPLPPVIVRFTAVEFCRLPLVPITAIRYVPAAAEALPVKVSVEVPEPLAMLDGLKAAVTPAGSPLTVSATLDLKLLKGATVIVEVP